MSAINELRETLEHTQTASFVTTMLRDISATKLQSIRALFDANQAYFLELHGLMALVQTYGKKFSETHGQEQDTAKRVYVAVTSNKRFYGTLNNQVIHALEEALAHDGAADCVVIGQTGRQIIESRVTDLKPTFLSFQSDEPSEAEIFSCIQSLSGYTEVLVMHPTFFNSFDQHAMQTDLTHIPKEIEVTEEKTLDYLFEPEIPKIITFFKTQIRLVLFARVVLETRLALTGARLMKMQRARERAEELLKVQRRVIHKEITTVQSMRLLEAFSGFRSKNTL